MFTKKHYKTIGYATFKDFSCFMKWAAENGSLWEADNWSKERNQLYSNNWNDDIHIGLYDYQNRIECLSESLELYDCKWNTRSELQEDMEYYSEIGQKFSLIYYEPKFAIICSGRMSYLIPDGFLNIEFLKDYDQISVSQLHQLTGNSDMPEILPAKSSGLSLKSVKGCMEHTNKKIEENREMLKKLQDEKGEELERIKKELDEKYRSKMDELEQQKQKLDNELEKMEKQIFLLNTQIYSIRCYMGEVVQFSHLVSGAFADINNPIIAYQKIRYIDEEMGKYLSIYDFEGADIKYFEQALSSRQDLRDLLVPGPKAIVFLRLSRNGKAYVNHPAVANQLTAYKKIHGDQLGIVIRDGDNLWMGFLDEEKFEITSEDAYLKPKKGICDEGTVYTDSKEERASRLFIFHILQGILDDGKMLHIPEKISMMKPSPYLVLSYADGWLEDNRFGTFSDIVARTNGQPLKKGDMVLTTMRITRDDAHCRYNSYGRAWDNNRGRGEKNRTHDAHLPNCRIYPVNQIDIEEIYVITCKRYHCELKEVVESLENGSKISHFRCTRTDKLIRDDVEHKLKVCNGFIGYYDVKKKNEEELYKFILDIDYFNFKEDHIDYDILLKGEKSTGYYEVPDGHIKKISSQKHYFLAAQKDSRFYAKPVTANMEIFDDEYLNLTYLNTVWVRYAIQNRKIGGWTVGNITMDYANSIPYLNKALQYLTERESEEEKLLTKYMSLYPDWQVDLSEWKMKHQFHRLTDKRAKAFAKNVPITNHNR